MIVKNPWQNKSAKRREAEALGFRSGLEKQVYDALVALAVPVEYEDRKIRYTKPAKPQTYNPDFTLPNGILIETKGRFTTKDRQKHLAIQAEYPGLEIRFVFGNSKNKIASGSKTTYAMWCETHGFQYADQEVPQKWLDERNNHWGEALAKFTTVNPKKERGELE
jgi:hypothetical protein